MKRRLLHATVVAAFLAGLGPVQPAFARPPAIWALGEPNCPHTVELGTGNFASVACLIYQGTAYLVETTFTNSTMYVTPGGVASGHHVANGIWAFSGIPCASNVEEQYVYGFHNNNRYEYAVARTDFYGVNDPRNAYEDHSDGVTGTGASTKFQIKYIGGTSWQLWRNDSLRWGFSGGNLGAGACIAEAGLEVSRIANYTPGIDSTYVAYTHDHHLAWYDTGWSLRAWPTNYSWINYPCGNGQNPPYCLNGTYYSGGIWSENKP